MMPVISGDAIFARNQTDAASSFRASIPEIFSLSSFKIVGCFHDLRGIWYESATFPAKSGTVGRSLALSLRIMLGGPSSWSGWSWVRIPLQHRRFGTLAIPFTPLWKSISGETLNVVGHFYLVSMPGEVKYPNNLHWRCVTCRGLHILA